MWDHIFEPKYVSIDRSIDSILSKSFVYLIV